MKLEKQELGNIIETVDSSLVVWRPTQSLRWKRLMKDEGSYETVLQQMWKGDKGEEEWKNVPIEW